MGCVGGKVGHEPSAPRTTAPISASAEAEAATTAAAAAAAQVASLAFGMSTEGGGITVACHTRTYAKGSVGSRHDNLKMVTLWCSFRIKHNQRTQLRQGQIII